MHNHLTISLLTGVLSFLTVNTYAQTALSIGSTMPDIKLTNIKNYPQKTISVSDLKGKAILFDFGTTSCSPCVDALKVLDSLQKLFSKDIQVFMVTSEKNEIVDAYLKNNKAAAHLSIPIITADTILSKYFRYRTIPHEVWIDKNTVVKAFTDHHYITHNHVDSLIKGFKLNWPVKWDFSYDNKQPLSILNPDLPSESAPDQIIHQSFFSKSLDGIKQGLTEYTDSIKKTTRVTIINGSIIEIYMALNDKPLYFGFPASRLIFDVKDPSKIFYDKSFGFNALWEKNNTYCYESIFPATLSKQERNKKIIEELDTYLGLKVRFEKRKIPCWILKQHNYGIDNSRKKETDEMVSLTNLVYFMNRAYPNPPVLDETGLPRSIRSGLKMNIREKSMTDLETLRKELEPYNIEIQIAERAVEVCVFTADKN